MSQKAAETSSDTPPPADTNFEDLITQYDTYREKIKEGVPVENIVINSWLMRVQLSGVRDRTEPR